MATNGLPPRFFKVFISIHCSETMMIPFSYYDELPNHLPKDAVLYGSHGGSWKVAMEYREEEDEVHFGQGWTTFVKDNSLKDGDFLTFEYDGKRSFDVSIYGPDTCKEARVQVETEDEEEEEESSKDTTSSESETTTNTILRSENKGKVKEEVEDCVDKEDNVYSLSSEDSTDTESTIETTNTKSRNKGKAIVESSDEDSESDSDDDDDDYMEAFGDLDVSDDSESESESSYSPNSKLDKKNPKKKDVVAATSDVSVVSKKKKKALKVRAKIKNPEAFLENPNNVYFETAVKNRIYELLVNAQLVKDYCLKFQDRVNYIDKYGNLEAKTAKWHDQRVCIKKWNRVIKRNKIQREDRILCELKREKNVVYAIKLHIVRGKDL